MRGREGWEEMGGRFRGTGGRGGGKNEEGYRGRSGAKRKRK